MTVIQTPDVIVKTIITELCTNDFDGIIANIFWNFVVSVCGEIDEFTKNVVWNWLLEKEEFQVWRKADSDTTNDVANTNTNIKRNENTIYIQEKNDSLPDFQAFFNDINVTDYKIKVSDDYQSLYLTGVQQKDNILGRMPYDLLRIIAKNKEKGINSLDLIEQSGQDKRSLTTRLQVLENNLLIVKFSVSVKNCVTNHMIHFRFAVKKSNTEEVSSIYYDRYEIITQIVDALKKEETKLRLTKDLYEEIKETTPALKLRAFNKILNFLVNNKFIEMVQVEYTARQRFFSAVRFLKDLPPAKQKTKFLEYIKEQSDNNNLQQNDDNNLLNLDENDEMIDQPGFTRFFPLSTQVYDLIEKNPGIVISKLDSELSGSFSTRQFSNIVESLSTTAPNPSNPRAVVGQMFHSGKSKFYRFTTQNVLNRRDPNYKFSEPKQEDVIPAGNNSLFEKSYLYGSTNPIERRLKFVSLFDKDNKDVYFMIPKGYKAPLGIQATQHIPVRATLSGNYQSSNGWINGDLRSKKFVKNVDEYKKTIEQEIKNVENFNIIADKENSILVTENMMDTMFHDTDKNETIASDNSDINNLSVTVNDGDKNTIEEDNSPIIDYGPDYRRNKIHELVDKNGCVCIDYEFCSKMSEMMKVDYKIDRRTLIRDAMALESQKLVTTEKNENGKFFVKSIINPPNKEQMELSITEPTRNRTRKFTSKIRIHDLSVRNENNLIRGWKFADKEMRLQHAMEAAKKKSSKPRSKRKKYSIINNGKEVDDDDNLTKKKDLYMEEVDEVNVSSDEDLFEPLMDDRKRKKFKANNRSQAKVARAFKKIRTSVKVTNEHVLKLIKTIVVTQSLSVGGNIDWPIVAKVLDDHYTIETLRRQWPRHRKMLGQRNLLQAKKNWENVLLDAVSDGKISYTELENYDIFKMLDIWKSQGADIFINKSENEILSDYDQNFKNQYFKPLKEESGPEIFRECSSMVEKEHVWTSKNFMYSTDQTEYLKFVTEGQNPTALQIAKTKLKALFATNVQKFNSTKVRELFSNIPKELYSVALTELENEKAIAFLGEHSKIKFTLTDRLMLILDCKLNNDFVKGAIRISEVFNELDTSHNAILLSTRSSNGCYAPLFSLMVDYDITVTRIDQKMGMLNSYYTKSLDRSKLESDFLISHYKKGSMVPPKNVPVPLGPPCSYLWVDLEGDFNETLWHKCIYVLIWSIVFNPGTPFEPLCSRLNPLLEPFEVKKILDWAVLHGNITAGEFGGYWPTKRWFYID